jgi:hypothetical protein
MGLTGVHEHYLLLLTVFSAMSGISFHKTISKTSELLKHFWKTLQEIRKTKKKKKRKK